MPLPALVLCRHSAGVERRISLIMNPSQHVLIKLRRFPKQLRMLGGPWRSGRL